MEIVKIHHNDRLGPNAPFPRPAIGTTSSCGVSQSLTTTLVMSKAIALVHKSTGEKKLWAGQPIINNGLQYMQYDLYRAYDETAE